MIESGTLFYRVFFLLLFSKVYSLATSIYLGCFLLFTHTIVTIPIFPKGGRVLVKKKRSKNFVYEVEVSNYSTSNEEFAMELFEMMEDATTKSPLKKINNFDELLEWNEEWDSGEL